MDILNKLSPLLTAAIVIVCIISCLYCMANKSNGHTQRSKVDIPIIVIFSGFLLCIVNNPNIMLNIGNETLKYVFRELLGINTII